jgi:hypothetical protein
MRYLTSETARKCDCDDVHRACGTGLDKGGAEMWMLTTVSSRSLDVFDLPTEYGRAHVPLLRSPLPYVVIMDWFREPLVG